MIVLKKYCRFIYSFFGLLGILGVYYIYFDNDKINNIFVNSIIFLMLAIIYKNIYKLNKREKIFNIVFSLFLAFITVIGAQLEIKSDIHWSVLTVLNIIFITFSFYPIINIVIYKLKTINPNNNFNIDTKKKKIGTFLIIWFLNLLVFLAMYPGLYGYDAGFQIIEFLDKGTPITSAFSVPFCFVLSKITELGNVVFGSYQLGFAVYCFLQMTFMTFVATKIIIFVIGRCKNKILYILLIIFYGAFPLFTVMSLSATQDTVFAGIFALILLNLLKMRDKNYWSNKKNPFILSVLIFLLCLMRNNGFYCIIFSFIVILLISKENRKKVLIVFLIPLIFYKIYSGPVLNFLNVVPGNSIREMSSIPSQQLARVYNYNKKAFSNKDLKNLNKFYDKIDNFKDYKTRQSISDPIKSLIKQEEVKKDPITYFKLYLNVGRKDIKNYTEAFLLNTLGLWYPNKTYRDDRMYHPLLEYLMLDAKFWNPIYIVIDRDTKLPVYDKLLYYSIEKNGWKFIPVISTLFTMGFYFILFLFLCGMIFVYKKYRLFIPLSIIVGLLLTIFLAPVSLFRYFYPIFIVTPIILSLILTINRKDDYFENLINNTCI